MGFWKDVICCCSGSGGGGTVIGCGDLASCSSSQGDVYYPIDISIVHELKATRDWPYPSDSDLECVQPCTAGSGCGCFDSSSGSSCGQTPDGTQFSDVVSISCGGGQPSAGCTNGTTNPDFPYNSMPCDGSPASGTGVDCVGSCFPDYDLCKCDDSSSSYSAGACGSASLAAARIDAPIISGTARCTVIPFSGHPNAQVTGTQTNLSPTGSPCVGIQGADLTSDLGAAFYTTQTSYQELKWDGSGPSGDCNGWSGLCGYVSVDKFMCVDALKTMTYGRGGQNIRYLTTQNTVSVDVPPDRYGPVLDLNSYSDAFVCAVQIHSQSMSHWELIKDNGWGQCYSNTFNPDGDEGSDVGVTLYAGMIAQKSASSLKFSMWGSFSTTPVDVNTHTSLSLSCKGFEIPADFSEWTDIP